MKGIKPLKFKCIHRIVDDGRRIEYYLRKDINNCPSYSYQNTIYYGKLYSVHFHPYYTEGLDTVIGYTKSETRALKIIEEHYFANRDNCNLL